MNETESYGLQFTQEDHSMSSCLSYLLFYGLHIQNSGFKVILMTVLPSICTSFCLYFLMSIWYMLLKQLTEIIQWDHQFQVLIFSQMTKMLDILTDYCYLRKIDYCRLDGSFSVQDRKEQVYLCIVVWKD